MALIDKAPGATTQLVLIDANTGQPFTVGWMDDIVDFNFGIGPILHLQVSSGIVPPTGTKPAIPFPISGLPWPVPNTNTLLAIPAPGASQPLPKVTDPFTASMVGAYRLWSIPGAFFYSLTADSQSIINDMVIPISQIKKAVGSKPTVTLSMVAPGYGNGFRITKKQIVYVPWNENEGLAFPGLDVDQWGNVFPVRAHGLNANDNGTLIVPGSPGSIPFLEDSGWGCWTTLAESDQECAALNTWFGHTPNYTSHAWEFWFTEWAGSDVFISAETFDAKGAKQLLKLKYTNPGGWNSVHNVSQAQPLYFTGHSSRTSSWGFVDAGTAHLGVTGIVSLTVDLNTLKLTGATVPP